MFRLETKQRNFVLQAKTKDEREEWIDIINLAINNMKTEESSLGIGGPQIMIESILKVESNYVVYVEKAFPFSSMKDALKCPMWVKHLLFEKYSLENAH